MSADGLPLDGPKYGRSSFMEFFVEVCTGESLWRDGTRLYVSAVNMSRAAIPTGVEYETITADVLEELNTKERSDRSILLEYREVGAHTNFVRVVQEGEEVRKPQKLESTIRNFKKVQVWTAGAFKAPKSFMDVEVGEVFRVINGDTGGILDEGELCICHKQPEVTTQGVHCVPCIGIPNLVLGF